MMGGQVFILDISYMINLTISGDHEDMYEIVMNFARDRENVCALQGHE